MYAITADQIDSRHGTDLVDAALADLGVLPSSGLALPAERTAGDELQLVAATPDAALDAVLTLARRGTWSIGLGIGDVDEPLPSSTRAASGPALFAARDAVERAKRVSGHFALTVAPGRRLVSADVEPLITQTLRARARRTDEGWALADLLADGATRSEAATTLGISQQAVAKRYATAGLGDDEALRHALVRLLGDADSPA